MKPLLFLFFITMTLKASAQVAFTKDLDPLIIKEFKEIRKLGSDTIFIYEKYCIGCEVIKSVKQAAGVELIPCVYKGFLQGKIFWKLNNKYYSKVISCTSIKNKIIETNGEIFEYFFSNLDCFKSLDKYKFTGKFFPPIPAHSTYEDLRLYTPKVIHEVSLAELQKEDKNWQIYEWIPPTIQIMRIVERTFSN